MDTVAAPRPDADATRSTRRERWAAFRWLRGASIRHGARVCYTPRLDQEAEIEDSRRERPVGSVEFGVTADGAVHVAGLRRCGSVWACPLCAPIIREQRAAMVDQLLARALADGCKLVFVTATASHDRADTLDGVRSGIHASWRFAFQGRKVYELATSMGNRGPWRQYVGQVRASDLTVGDNGWHPHIHAVLVFSKRASWAHITRWLDERRDDYLGSLGAWGMHATVAHGWDVRKVSARSRATAGAVARYVAKIDGGWGAGLELSRSDLKRSRGGRQAFELLRDAASGCDDSAELFEEYERATIGKRLIVTGRKLAQRYGVDPDAKTDDELSTVDPASFVFSWTVDGREYLRLFRAGYVVDLIEHFIECAHELRDHPPP